MTTEREKIISLARECGFNFLSQWNIPSCEVKDIEAFYHKAQAEAYEAAASRCEADMKLRLAAEIREMAKGNGK